MITKEELIKFGMTETTDDVLYPFDKVLLRDEDDGGSPILSLAVSMTYNNPGLVLIVPGGDILLGGIENIQQLEAIEKAITGYDSHF